MWKRLLFITGVYALGLLTAPRSGAETRQKIKDRFTREKDALKSKVKKASK